VTAPRRAVPRRAFLDLAGRVVVGSFLIYGAPGAVLTAWAACTTKQGRTTFGVQSSGPRVDLIVDTLKCIGCGRCVRACKEECRPHESSTTAPGWSGSCRPTKATFTSIPRCWD
jgi:hypothetical protein